MSIFCRHEWEFVSTITLDNGQIVHVFACRKCGATKKVTEK